MIKRPFLFMLVAAALSYGAVVASSPASAQYNNEPEDSLPTPGTQPPSAGGSDPEDTRPPPPDKRIVKLMRERQQLIDRCERRFNLGRDLENIQAKLRQNERKLVRFGASPIAPAPSYCSEATEASS
ncbi:MAG: hypothetical protein IPM60_18025 [Rhodospirillales bacterium]|nr:hypothetical protein [Rhodospirillales bacterium]